MNLTATDIRNNALEHLGAKYPQFGLPTDIGQSMFTELNRMLDLWQIDKFMVLAILPNLYTLTAGIQRYTIGIGASGPYGFNTQWPVRIEMANVILGNTVPVLRMPLAIQGFQQWGDIRVVDIPYAIPQQLWWDSQYPISNLYFWPGPMSSYQVELFMPQPLTQFADLTTSYQFAPGYSSAIEMNLAIRCYSRLRHALKIAMDPLAWGQLKEDAAIAKRLVEERNEPERVIYCDPAYTQSRASGFNWLSGETTTVRR